MKYIVAIEPPSKECAQYGAIVPDLPGCYSMGKTVDDALNSSREAIECWLEVYPKQEASKKFEKKIRNGKTGFGLLLMLTYPLFRTKLNESTSRSPVEFCVVWMNKQNSRELLALDKSPIW